MTKIRKNFLIVLIALILCAVSFWLGGMFNSIKRKSIPLEVVNLYTTFQIASNEFDFTVPSDDGLRRWKTNANNYSFITYGKDIKQEFSISKTGFYGFIDNGYRVKADENRHDLIVQVVAAAYMTIDQCNSPSKSDALNFSQQLIDSSDDLGHYVVDDSKYLIEIYNDSGLYTIWIDKKINGKIIK